MAEHLEIEQIYKTPTNYVYLIEDSLTKVSNLSYEAFFEKFMLNNLPCVIGSVSEKWECSNNWIQNDEINTVYLEKQYGHLTVPVADCKKLLYNSHCKTDKSFFDYINYLKVKGSDVLYLKDWHLKKACPNDNFYETPKYFASDWLNEFALDNGEDDYMFVYIGPKESWTPFHADVYESFSWSVNIVGRKKWILFPPSEEIKLKDSLGNLPLNVDELLSDDIHFIKVIQEKGDAIFVPSGWYHQVHNELDTISINHNWVNGCNINLIWKGLKNTLKTVEKEIEEFKGTEDFNYECQLMLKALFGMDIIMFVKLISHIADKRIRQLKDNICFQVFNMYFFGENHLIFDLTSIRNIVTNILNDDTVTCYLKNDIDSLKSLFQNINDIISR